MFYIFSDIHNGKECGVDIVELDYVLFFFLSTLGTVLPLLQCKCPTPFHLCNRECQCPENPGHYPQSGTMHAMIALFPTNYGSVFHAIIAFTVCFCACRTPLHAAAFAEDVAGLQLVLRHGAEINAVDKSGRSALMVAADKGHSGTVGKGGSAVLQSLMFP